MEYMILLYSDDNAEGAPSPGDPGFEEMMAGFMAYNQRLIDGGHYVSGAGLAASESATTVAKNGDQITITDGPFMETKEAIGGFYVVEAADLDEAIELAKAVPIPVGHFEVRPVAFNPASLG